MSEHAEGLKGIDSSYMYQRGKYDIHLCRNEEKLVACELAAMEDFEGIHPDMKTTRHQDLKNWGTFYRVASQLIDECPTIVATEDGKVIGLVNYTCASAYGTINYLYVLPNRRHQGVGKALLENAEKHIATDSIRFARVSVNLYEDSIIKFCKKMGYSARQVIMKKSIKSMEEETLKNANGFPNGRDECD